MRRAFVPARAFPLSCGVRLFGAALALSCTSPAAADAVLTLACDANDAVPVTLPAFGRSLRLQWTDPRPGSVTLEERGVDVVVVNIDAAAVLPIESPPRLGFHVVDLAESQSVALSRLRPAGLPGGVVARVHCDLDAPARAERAWLERVRAAATAAASPDQAVRDQATAAFDAAARAAPKPALRALALHLSAQAAFRAGRSRQALDGFVVAESAWRAAGETAPAIAARVAQVDEHLRLGQYRQAIDAATTAPGAARASPYYALRLATTRCLSQRYLGDLATADRCYTQAIAAYEKADEFAEAASALQDQADVALRRGQSERAIALDRRSLQLAQGPDAAVLRGRAHLSLSIVFSGTADIQSAIRENELALAEFETAGARRWSANGLMRAAYVYASLGAIGDARDAIRQALERLSDTDAPARVAAARLALARVELQDGRIDAASHALDDAGARFARLALEVEQDAVRVEQLRIAIRRNDTERIGALRRALQPTQIVDVERGLTLAAALLAEGDVAAARAQLAALRRSVSSLAQTIELARLDAGIEIAQGRHAQGRAMLAHARQGLDRIVAGVRNPVLRIVLSNRIVDLGRDAIDSLRAEHGGREGAYPRAAALEVWAWVADAALANDAAGDGVAGGGTESFDRAVATELLAGADAKAPQPSPNAHRELLSALAQARGGTARVAASLTLEALQRTLGDDERFVAHADGLRGGLLLWISRDRVELVDTANAAELSAHAASLAELAATPGGDPAQIRQHATVLAEALRLGVSGPPPRRLIVHRDGALGGIAWNILVWPGADEPLVSSTTTTVAPLAPLRAADAWRPMRRLSVVVADGDGGAQLPVASVEPRLVRTALGARESDVEDMHDAGRDEFLALLSAPGQWVHVAAHGIAQPGRLGRSGLLLGGRASASPQFVSWLDVAGGSHRAALVVLAACDTGAGYDSARNNLGFAAGLSRSGVSHVVAALWPMSDAATAVWVPAFYGALASDASITPADAARLAAQRLRSTPYFRHPYYWGSLVAIERRSPADERTTRQ
jgi:tetratricopeptide (TPR) repeat protein